RFACDCSICTRLSRNICRVCSIRRRDDRIRSSICILWKYKSCFMALLARCQGSVRDKWNALSQCSRVPREDVDLARVESRMGTVAWAMRQRSVSDPRSSNWKCGFPASGCPTGFTVKYAAGLWNVQELQIVFQSHEITVESQ